MQNTLCWVDIPVADLSRARQFYATVLGQPIDVQKHEGMEFAVLPHAQDQVSGCLVVSEKNKPSEHGPLIYLSVEGRLDAAAKLVESAGGKIADQKFPLAHSASASLSMIPKAIAWRSIPSKPK